ncbi:MAG TPA: hypothetical protein PKE26_03700 [Kiritimatiellia bacterium]|nr:hypothetical protein [Kiritimatiellia bacterium]HMO98195.1 hypothetical protein [Kiritimatiellia bacterium]HMP96487.1 hypothetical protein [Kiritimatiellia bacterium]
MIFSRRDFHLVLVMIGVLLLGLTYLLGAPRIEQWRQAATVRERLERDRAVAERILNTRGEWEGQLSELRATLPRYGMNEAVGAELLRQVRRLADENRVITTRITPDAEKMIGDLYEQAIEVTWEAGLEPLVRFLYAVQVAGATLDIRQMTMTPSQGDQLKGNLKIFFAYQRVPPEAEVRDGG